VRDEQKPREIIFRVTEHQADIILDFSTGKHADHYIPYNHPWEQKLAASNRPKKVSSIRLPDDGSRVGFQNVPF
jgi:hypothetical protein